MSQSNSPSVHLHIDRALPLLLFLFVGSGCAALIYEIVWFQLLQFMIGLLAISLGRPFGYVYRRHVLGSLVLPYWISSVRGIRFAFTRHLS